MNRQEYLFKDLIMAYTPEMKDFIPRVREGLDEKKISYKANSKNSELILSSDQVNEKELNAIIKRTNFPSTVLDTFVKVKKSSSRIYIRQRVR